MTGWLSGRQVTAGVSGRPGGDRPADAQGGTAAGGTIAGGDGTRRGAVLVAPGTVAWSGVGFAVIAAVWLTLGSSRADLVALAALLAAYAAARAGRAIAGPAPPPAVGWSLLGCAVLSEFAVCAGMASAASLHPGVAAPSGPAASALAGTFAADIGGAGAAGLWRLAVTAVAVAAMLPMLEICRQDPAPPGAAPRPLRRGFGMPGDARLPLAGAVLVLAGERAALAVLLALGAVAIGAALIGGSRARRCPGERRGYRGDGRLAVRLGGLVGGRIPPMAPLLAGLLVTGVLAALGLRNLPGILVLTPVEAMLLAALGSWHPHDGRRDWLVPPLLQAAEYVFIAEVGFAARLWPAVTLALIAAAGLRHLALAYLARAGLASGVDRRGLGWEGRMLVTGVAAAAGIQLAVYPALALHLWWLAAADWAAARSAGHAAVDR